MPVTNKVKVIDRGMLDIKHELKLMDGAYAAVGFPENATVGKGIEGGSGNDSASTISEVAEIAIKNEFGVDGPPKIPARPFMSTSFDEKKDEIIALQKKVYRATTGGRMGTKQAIGILGVYGASLIREKITEIKTPPNAQMTIDLKGSSNPLIDTGQMRASVTHTVILG